MTQASLTLAVVVAAGAVACGSHRGMEHAERTPLRAVVACLTRAGADAAPTPAGPDLATTGGELAIAFNGFDLYVGLASDRAEAAHAAMRLNALAAAMQQTASAEVDGDAVVYSDSPVAPAASRRLVHACLALDPRRAADSVGALVRSRTQPELPAQVEAGFVAWCRRAGGSACVCAYDRAARLYRFSTLAELADRPWRARAIARALLIACEASADRRRG
ncbi:MAG TPA: hypothetical protein VI408_07535 [Gaiellaceae bacterium]